MALVTAGIMVGRADAAETDGTAALIATTGAKAVPLVAGVFWMLASLLGDATSGLDTVDVGAGLAGCVVVVVGAVVG